MTPSDLRKLADRVERQGKALRKTLDALPVPMGLSAALGVAKRGARECEIVAQQAREEADALDRYALLGAKYSPTPAAGAT